MAQLRRGYAAYRSRGAEVMVVGPEGRAEFARYWMQHSLPFIGLPDPLHSVLKLYGQQVKLFKLGRMPAQALIDREGVVRYVHYGHAMSDIPDQGEVLALLDELNLELQTAAG